MTGWQAIQFSIANQEIKSQFEAVIITGAWDRSVLKDFKTIELEGFDKYGRLIPRKILSTISQLRKIEQELTGELELWRPDIGGHVVEKISRLKNIKSIVHIEDGIGSIAVKKPKILKIKNQLKLLAFLIISNSTLTRKRTGCVKNLIFEGISHKKPKNKDIIISKDRYIKESIKISQIKNKNISTQLLVLTQPIAEMGYISIDQEIEMQKRLIEIAIKEAGEVHSIAIKPHPGEDDKLSKRRVSEIEKTGKNVILIDKKTPAELYFISLETPPKAIASYCSSALPNIKKAFSKTNCIALFGRELTPFIAKEIIDQFKEIGISTHVS